VKNIVRQNSLYDSHPGLPLDPDVAQPGIARPAHADPALMGVVLFGAFFGTLARYGMTEILPSSKDAWPVAVTLTNLVGAFSLGLLLQILQNHGRDEGRRRLIRLGVGTGFLGAFTTYSSLAVAVDILGKDGHVVTAVLYALCSLVGGIVLSALGIQVAMRHHRKRSEV
jgi:CrcB protein